MAKDILTGNCEGEKNKHRGWITGHFIDKSSPLHTQDLEIKWGEHKKGEAKENPAANNQSKTLAILIYGQFQFDFPNDKKQIVLNKKGDYVFFNAKINHSWQCLKNSLVLTIRWPSLPNDQKISK